MSKLIALILAAAVAAAATLLGRSLQKDGSGAPLPDAGQAPAPAAWAAALGKGALLLPLAVLGRWLTLLMSGNLREAGIPAWLAETAGRALLLFLVLAAAAGVVRALARAGGPARWALGRGRAALLLLGAALVLGLAQWLISSLLPDTGMAASLLRAAAAAVGAASVWPLLLAPGAGRPRRRDAAALAVLAGAAVVFAWLRAALLEGLGPLAAQLWDSAGLCQLWNGWGLWMVWRRFRPGSSGGRGRVIWLDMGAQDGRTPKS